MYAYVYIHTHTHTHTHTYTYTHTLQCRPLACGDPIRRLVAKCFCVGGKEEISKAFAGRNYGGDVLEW